MNGDTEVYLNAEVLQMVIAEAASDRRDYQRKIHECIAVEAWAKRKLAEMGQTPDPEKLRNQSVKQSLIDIAVMNGNILENARAVELLWRAGVGSRDQVSSAVRSNLYQNKEIFENLDRGRYLYVGSNPQRDQDMLVLDEDEAEPPPPPPPPPAAPAPWEANEWRPRPVEVRRNPFQN